MKLDVLLGVAIGEVLVIPTGHQSGVAVGVISVRQLMVVKKLVVLGKVIMLVPQVMVDTVIGVHVLKSDLGYAMMIMNVI